MQRSWFRRLVVWTSVPLGWAILVATVGAAEDAEVLDTAAAEKAAVREKEPPQPDPYTVPDGDAAALVAFIKHIQQMPRQLRNITAQIEYRQKAPAALLGAADKILAGKPDDAQTALAVRVKLHALEGLNSLGDEQARETLAAFADSLKNDSRPMIRLIVERFFLSQRVRAARGLDDGQRKKLVDDILAFARRAPLDVEQLWLVMGLGEILEMSGDDRLAATLYGGVAPRFQASESQQLADYGNKMVGMARRMTLVGNPMQVKGDLLDGTALDWSAYRGKVVLVDFWATWCGPCLAELPNLKHHYELYHDKGFDVVGISLDEDRAKLEEFVDSEAIPWPILFSDDPEAQGWDHPTAVYYGITGIPTAILVDQQGNVVTLEARNDALARQLEKLLGKVEQPAGEPSSGQVGESGAQGVKAVNDGG